MTHAPPFGSLTIEKPARGPKPKDYGTGRVCAEDGCDTRLCRYHKGDKCWSHAPREKFRWRVA